VQFATGTEDKPAAVVLKKVKTESSTPSEDIFVDDIVKRGLLLKIN
jgi:hypothetical protein